MTWDNSDRITIISYSGVGFAVEPVVFVPCSEHTMSRTVKIAVVGSGLAGLTAAYLLTRPDEEREVRFEVHLFEKTSALGMDSSSVSLPIPGREEAWRIDVPMRSFQGGYYPQLISLYKRLGIAFREADFSYSFSLLSISKYTQTRQITTTMIYNGASGRAGVSMPSIMNEPCIQTKCQGLAIRAVTKAWTIGIFIFLTLQVLICYLRLLTLASPFWRKGERVEMMTFRKWTKESVPKGVLARWTGMDEAWREFTKRVLLPLFSAVCTASEEDVMEHPVEEILDYVWLTLGTHHYIVVNGVQDVVSRLTATVQHIHLSSSISAICVDVENPNLASIHCNVAGGIKIYSGFDHLILATQATRAVPLLESFASSLLPDAPQRKLVEEQILCLRMFEYRPSIVVNHTDDRLMPDDVRDRRDLNLVCLEAESHISPCMKTKPESAEWVSSYCVSSSYTMATHVLAPPPGYPPHSPLVYQTTNPIVPPEKDCVLSVARLERAVLTLGAKKALKGLCREEGRRWWQCAAQGKSGLGTLQGAGRLDCVGGGGVGGGVGPGIWVCGAYAYAGIPLLEGCVVSSRNIVEGICKSEGVGVGSSPW